MTGDGWTYEQAIRYLNSRTNYERKAPSYGPVTYDLQRMARLANLLGNPERRYPVVHVTGTKGKGSVATMVESCARAAGLSTGLFTSPHLIDLRERIAVDGLPIGEKEFAVALAEVSRVVEHIRAVAIPPHPTFFEVMTATAFVHFARRNVGLGVFEVGMGGRLDSTNVVLPEVCVLTRIGLDHTKQLGSTVGEIATEKAGIIKTGVPVVTAAQELDAADVIRQTSERMGSRLWRDRSEIQVTDAVWNTDPPHWRLTVRTPLAEHRDLELPLLGRHQLENCALAVAALDILGERGIVPGGDDWMRRGLRTLSLPARFQYVVGRPARLLDGAHNPLSIGALMDAIREFLKYRRLHLVFAMASDKDVDRSLEILLPHTDAVYFTLTNSPRATPPEDLAARAAKFPKVEVHVEPDPNAAYRMALAHAGPDDLVVITGSLYLVGDLMGSLGTQA